MTDTDDITPDHDMEVVYVGPGERMTHKVITRSVVILANDSEFEDCELHGCDLLYQDGSPIPVDGTEELGGEPASLQSCPEEIRRLLLPEVRARGATLYLQPA